MRKLLEDMENQLRFLAKKITEAGYDCEKIEVGLWRGKSIRITAWNNQAHLQYKHDHYNSVEDLLTWFKQRELLFRKFN